MASLSTHVLDTARGKPAAGVAVTLEAAGPDGWHELARGTTDADGRIRELVPADARMEPGTYRLTFDVGRYFTGQGIEGFYATIAVTFIIRDPGQHHHVPLLLSPFGYSTYRGT